MRTQPNYENASAMNMPLGSTLLPPLLSQQIEARDKTLNELAEADRCKIIMACGTGKTRIGPEIAIGLNARIVVIYLPSLALMRQTLPDWINAAFRGGTPTVLCVCSDATVADSDAPIVTVDELAAEFHNPVTTKSDEVKRFLAAPSNQVRLVFCTYHSSDVLSAGCPDGFMFDMGLFDEAHRTAGKEGAFSGPLADAHTPIRKRVFMTATPKHYKLRKSKNKDSPAQLAFSMDQESLYGRTAYNLPLREAIERRLIADYKVLIAVVDDQTIANQLQGNTAICGTEHMAHAVAIKDAMKKYGVNKVVTFHDSVKDAQHFSLSPVVQQELGAVLFHVSGMIPTRDRETIMQQFAASPCSVATNARCLTEGVDVPAIDMVAFLHPKKSKIDIIQAIGRALRLPQGSVKTHGYILLPIYVSEIENGGFEKALKESGFDSIVQVIQALKEQDANVEACYTDSAKRGKASATDFDFVHITGPSAYLELLRSAITAQHMEYLVEDWWVNYGKLEKFYFEQGHSDVSANSKLGNWCAGQRKLHKENKLAIDKVEALNKLGFKFKAKVMDDWWVSYEKLKVFFVAQGHSDASTNSKLGSWCHRQRQFHKANKLAIDKVEALNKIGFKFKVIEEMWWENYRVLEIYFIEHGDSDVPLKNQVGSLGSWCVTQRTLYKNSNLTPDRIEALKKVNFKWDVRDESWWDSYSELEKYFIEHGNSDVPLVSELRNWCKEQRKQYKDGTLKLDRIEALKKVNFKWDVRDESWWDSYSELEKYFIEHGNSDVPRASELMVWCKNQRKHYKKSNLPPDRIEALKRVKFKWDLFDESWWDSYSELEKYFIEHGNSDAPTRSKLGSWCKNQRQSYKDGTLKQNRFEALKKLDCKFKFDN